MAHTIDDITVEGLTGTKSFRTQALVQATAASTLTLTVASEASIMFTGTTAGQILKLGDATTYQVGHRYEAHNNSTQNVSLTDNANVALATIKAGQRASIILQNSSTAAGIWAVIVGQVITTATVVSVGSANAAGTSTSLSASDHVHQGIHSLKAKAAGTARFGDLILEEGNGITITDSGTGTFTIDSSVLSVLPAVQARRSTIYTLEPGFTNITFDLTDYENASSIVAHDVTNTDRINFVASGLYLCSFGLNTECDTVASYNFRARLNNTTVIPGSESDGTAASTLEGTDETSKTFLIQATAGDFITLQGQGSVTGNQISDNATLVVVKMQGVKGDQGDVGAGSNVIIQDDGSNIPNTPHSTLNFTQGIKAVDSGSGVTAISLAPSATTQAVANSTLSLTSTSATTQFFTGTTMGQIVSLPNATTLTIGTNYKIVNLSTTCLQVVDNASGMIDVVLPLNTLECTVQDVGIAAGAWGVYQAFRDPLVITNYEDFYYAATGSGGNRYDFALTAAGGGTQSLQQRDTTGSSYIRLNTGTTNNSTGSAGIGAYNNVAIDDPAVRYMYMAARVRVPTLSAGGVLFTTLVGWGSSVANPPVNGLFFSYSSANNSGRWQALTRAASTSTTINGGATFAVAANTWYTLEIFKNAANNSVEFFVNGIRMGISTTNIPTAQMLPFAIIQKQTTSTTTSSPFDIDSLVWRRR